jgi:hypothetical protein
MYCKNCLHADFNSSDSETVGYGTCRKLIGLTIDNSTTQERELVSIERQPTAFHYSTCEIGYVSSRINIHPNFGCVEFTTQEAYLANLESNFLVASHLDNEYNIY